MRKWRRRSRRATSGVRRRTEGRGHHRVRSRHPSGLGHGQERRRGELGKGRRRGARMRWSGSRRGCVGQLHLLMQHVLHASVLILLLLQVHQLGVYQRVVLSHVHAVDGRGRGRGGGVGRRVRGVRVEGVMVEGEQGWCVERGGHCEGRVGGDGEGEAHLESGGGRSGRGARTDSAADGLTNEVNAAKQRDSGMSR